MPKFLSITTKTLFFYGLLTAFYLLSSSSVFAYTDQAYFIHQDHLGSVIAVSNESGDVVQQTKYAPYGSVGVSHGNPLQTERGYTGQIRDSATSLQYYNARYYDSTISRFVAPDKTNDQTNRFAYVGGNPVMKNDPSGNREEEFSEIENVGFVNPFDKIVNKYKKLVVYNQPEHSSACGPYALANILPNLGSPEKIVSQMQKEDLYSSYRGTNLDKIKKYLRSQGYSSAYVSQEIKSDEEIETFFQQVTEQGDVAIVGVRKYYDPNYRSPNGILGHLVSPQETFRVNDKLYVAVIDPYPYSNSELERMRKQGIFKISNLLFVPAQIFTENLRVEGGTKAILLIKGEGETTENPF